MGMARPDLLHRRHGPREGPDVLVQPDVFVVPRDDARTLTWSRMRTLLLVAEVLSPSSMEGDRFLKRLR
jgi:hypothetical protein